ncbi:myosin-10-like isoform X2 [Mytilus edulis]|uniref:myosin-10-like isoform X2 n=1 Tax=Mytilus edulis TaxID=6550 RepID=UPI0039EFFF03
MDIPVDEILMHTEEPVEPMDYSETNIDEKIHRFFLELITTHGLKWTTFLADLGFRSKLLLKLPQEKKDDHFCYYLEYWLGTVTFLGQNPVSHLYRALIKSQHKDLVDELKLKFPSGTIGSISDQEFADVERHLLHVNSLSNTAKKIREPTGFDIHEELMRVEREIWRNITDHELQEIKAYLRNKKREKFGKKVLEEIKTCVDLMQKLHETCLVQENNFGFLKAILKFVNREDLIQKITALEERINGLPKENEFMEVSATGSTLKLKMKVKQNLVSMFSSSTRIIQQKIADKTQDLQKIDERATELTSKSESCRQKMEECAKQKMQIEIQIRNLRSEADVLQCSEKTLGSEFISIQKDKDALKYLHKKQATELDSFRNKLKRENELLVKHKKELESMKQELNRVEHVDPKPVNEKPAILVMAAVENIKDLETFKCDVQKAVSKNKILDVVIENNTTAEFLSETDKQMQTAKLIFILVSDVFVKRCWPDVSKMKNLTSALVDKNPLVVPVKIVANVRFPMGLKSAHCLAFHRCDGYYKEALGKVLKEIMEYM